MIDTINQLIKAGKLIQAAEILHGYARQIQADNETIQDIVVLSGSLSDLERQEKRKKVTAQEAHDTRIRLSYEMTDIIESLSSPSSNIQPPKGGGMPPEWRPEINNQIEININIENIISNEIKIELQAVKHGFEELKTQLLETKDDASLEAVQEIEVLAEDLDGLAKATSKDQVPSLLENIGIFFKRLEDGNDSISRAIKTAKNGAAVAQKLAKNYNSIAQWVGLPVLPPIILGD